MLAMIWTTIFFFPLKNACIELLQELRLLREMAMMQLSREMQSGLLRFWGGLSIDMLLIYPSVT